MGKVFYLHWNEEEARERARELREDGHEVLLHWTTQTTPRWGDYLPDVFVVSLDRLPSHGRSYAEWFWEAKKRQGIPIVFAGGQSEKVEVTRRQFPNAIFCATEELPAIVRRALANSSSGTRARNQLPLERSPPMTQNGVERLPKLGRVGS